MDILFDTANLDDIERLTPIYPVTGVTTNPSILKAEGKIDFYPHMRRIREIIGPNRTLHVQVLAKTAQGMIDDAHRLLDKIDADVYPKIPTTEAGIAAMRHLKEEGVKVTATAIYSKTQGFLAIATGVDYLAPYYNRMQSLDIDTRGTIEVLAGFIKRFDAPGKIMAASFKNVAQVSHALESGADAVTLSPKLLRAALSAPDIDRAVDDFIKDWKAIYGTTELP
ncbi:fructose-6-phosphate aldolase [Tessaracoccus flavus]|uniref:Fructose-bisphosphate aldolase n=1 Tax=Tessaracoccus flavus TaxID=1610493 RepID=A0A1Q2CGU0_9ACTN|nr:fructose-6-phosphate aldolase [Tessaracoccus flavus]AQP45338.1 fructose-bisphosphate aldolase [Tessaracoccus flavus]SDY48283.1 fructose-6-phosphate aldolase, TalC/MipB family [Tessaracoccus flavus]